MMTKNDLILCQTADGWSLHAPHSTDDEIASGEAPYILCGEGRPTAQDYDAAFDRWLIEAAA